MNENPLPPPPEFTPYVPPVLQVEPRQLDFGGYNPDLPLLQQPQLTVTITNTGGSTLIGRLIPQVSWLMIHPIPFTCAPGESSTHTLQLSTGAPLVWNEKVYSQAHAVIISSNGGAAALDVQFTLDTHKPVYTPVNLKLTPHEPDKWQVKILLPLALLLFAALLVVGLANLFIKPKAAPDTAALREELLTQGAQTMLAQMTNPAGTAAPVEAQEGAVFGQQATPTSLSVFAPLTTNTPDLTATAFHPTFTPWVAEYYPNPEDVVTQYFALLAARDYSNAWLMLSRAYQETCCNALGTDPYYIYARDWNEVETVTLVSAKIQEYDRNPAPVQVSYQVKKFDEESREIIAMFWLISDDTQPNLLIDVIDDLGD